MDIYVNEMSFNLTLPATVTALILLFLGYS